MIEVYHFPQNENSCSDRFHHLVLPPAELQTILDLATQIGSNDALLLCKLDLVLHERGQEIEANTWAKITLAEWYSFFGKAWSKHTTQNILDRLRTKGLVLSRADLNAKGLDQSLWYAIDYGKLRELMSDRLIGYTNSHKMRNGRLT